MFLSCRILLLLVTATDQRADHIARHILIGPLVCGNKEKFVPQHPARRAYGKWRCSFAHTNSGTEWSRVSSMLRSLYPWDRDTDTRLIGGCVETSISRVFGEAKNLWFLPAIQPQLLDRPSRSLLTVCIKMPTLCGLFNDAVSS